MVKIDVHEIVLFACNTGELYETHKQLARSGAKRDAWLDHVSGRVLTLYGKQVQRAWAPLQTRMAAAAELKAYYERHIQEGGL